MHHVRPEPAEIGADHVAVFGVRADLSRQAEQRQRLVEVHRVGRPTLGQRGARRLGVFLAGLALLHVRPEPARAQGHRLALVIAQNLVARLCVGIAADGAGVAAFGVARATHETASARGLEVQAALAAQRALARIAAILAGRVELRGQRLVELVEHFGDPQFRGFGDRGGEIAPELGQHGLVVQIARRDLVKLFLQFRGELVAHVFAEEIQQEDRDDPALVLGEQAVLVLADIFAVLDRGDDAGIGRGPADPQLFHLLDQRRLGVARGRLREMLLAQNGALVRQERLAIGRQAGVLVAHGGAHLFELVALGDLRQAAVVLGACVVIAPFLVDLHEPVEEHHLPGGAQFHLVVVADDIDGGAFQPRGLHLAGNRALPDQVIKLLLVGLGHAQGGRVLRHVRGADAFVGFLRVLGLVLVHARAVGQVFGAVAILDRVARGHHRLGRHVDPVGPHIGDMARLVEPLRRVHRLARAHAELAAGFLLQGRGHEGRRGVAHRGLGLDRAHAQRPGGHRVHRKSG